MLLGGTAWFETDDEDVASHEWRGLTFEPLRKRGHSKEGRDNDPQVIVALAVTREGMPVRSWVFPWQHLLMSPPSPRSKTICVACDWVGRCSSVTPGMYSAANLKELSKGAGRYILATPIRIGERDQGRGPLSSRPLCRHRAKPPSQGSLYRRWRATPALYPCA